MNILRPAGRDEQRATLWTTPTTTAMPQQAGMIHRYKSLSEPPYKVVRRAALIKQAKVA
jgi:hypothetical protein